jgi:hypothetical protein
MSLQDDIKMVKAALKGSRHSEWPDPVIGEDRYPAFEAFRRICDQMPPENYLMTMPAPLDKLHPLKS